MKSFKLICTLVAAATLFLTSCSKDDDEINESQLADTGVSVVATESCPKIGIDFITFEKEGNLDIKVNGSSDEAESVYNWKVTGPGSKTIFSKTSTNKELYWAPEIGTTTFELLVTTKECPSGRKITKTFIRTTEDVSKAATVLASPSTTACPRVDVKVLTSKEEPGIGSDIKLVASISGGTNPIYAWEILLDGKWLSYYPHKSASNTTSNGPGLGTQAKTFRVTVTTDECTTGAQIIKTVVTKR
jgi:hypothetical protein